MIDQFFLSYRVMSDRETTETVTQIDGHEYSIFAFDKPQLDIIRKYTTWQLCNVYTPSQYAHVYAYVLK